MGEEQDQGLSFATVADGVKTLHHLRRRSRLPPRRLRLPRRITSRPIRKHRPAISR